MARFTRLVLALLFSISRGNGETFSVRISTESHVNEIDSRFVSFTIDPKYLFTSSDDLSCKESTCMAASLTPAYLRIAGPSTSHIIFNNRSLTIDQIDPNLPEPNKQKRHLKTKEFDYDSEESHEDILTKLKRSSERLLKRHRRHLDASQEIETLEESKEKLLPKLKKSKIRDVLTKRKIAESTNTDEDSNEKLLPKLKSKIHDALTKRNMAESTNTDKVSKEKLRPTLKSKIQDALTKRNTAESKNTDQVSEEKLLPTLKSKIQDALMKRNIAESTNTDEVSEEKLLPTLKSKIQDAMTKRNIAESTNTDEVSEEKLLPTLKSKIQDAMTKRNIAESKNTDEASEEKLLPTLKSKIHDALAKRTAESDNEEKLPSIEDEESHETILSKMKKPRRLRLLSKLKNQDESEERPRLRRSKGHLEVSRKQWKRFTKWAKETGFSLVFAVNNGEKTESGMWDPNPALNMLTIADKDEVQDIFWQLGYECTNQTLEDYLNDLQTLRMMVDSFGARRWKVVGGDVSGCLEAGSKSDFKDYVTLSSDSMDAVLLNGNSSSHELARMSESSRLSLLRTLSASSVPLWLTEHPQQRTEQARAADWLTSLGYSAKNGFHVHFRELLHNELNEPTLSFYMALLFKNLVGERVLDVTMEPSDGQAALFAHCTSLRHKPVPGAVTLYGVNMDSEPARFSVKLAKREEGGDIMQFILGHDHSGNIVVNGRPMFYEGNIRPVVKRVRPYKTLLLNLPPKTFGFWVLANTKVNACYDYEDKDNATLVEAKSVTDKIASKELDVDGNKSKPTNVTEGGSKEQEQKEDNESEEKVRSKRSINLDDFGFDIDVTEYNDVNNDEALRNRIESMNRGLRDVQGLMELKDNLISNRVKREMSEEEFDSRKKLRQFLKKGERKSKHEHKLSRSGIFEKLINNINGMKIPKLNLTRSLKELKHRKTAKTNVSKLSKRNSRNYRNREEELEETNETESQSRRKRSLLVKNKKLENDKTAENEIEIDDKKHFKLGKFLKKHKNLQDYIDSYDDKSSDDENDEQKSRKNNDAIEINTKITDDDAEIKISENADHGLLKTAFENVLALLEELNHNLSKMWTALSFLE